VDNSSELIGAYTIENNGYGEWMDRGPSGLVGYRDVGATAWWPEEKG
jgi:hypothetical protein